MTPEEEQFRDSEWNKVCAKHTANPQVAWDYFNLGFRAHSARVKALEIMLGMCRDALGKIAKLADDMQKPSDEAEIAMIALKMIEPQ